MKNYNNYLFILALIFLFASCDQEGEFFDRDYMRLNFSIVYPEFTNPNDYTVTFNGKDITKTFFSRDELTGRLQVFAKDAEIPELDIEVTVVPNQNILLIKLPGKNIELYREEDFVKFSASISLFEGYKAVINDQEIVNGENYIRKDNTTGNLEFYGEEGTTPVDTIEDITLTEGENLIILQTSETEFVQLSGGDIEEPEPEGDHLSKVRFFYSPVGALNVDSIRLDIFAFNPMTGSDFIWNYKSVVVKKGELSPYVELDATLFKDYNSFAGFAYSISNAETDEIIDDGMSAANAFDLLTYNFEQGYFKALYKFATRQILNQPGYPSQIVEALSEKW